MCLEREILRSKMNLSFVHCVRRRATSPLACLEMDATISNASYEMLSPEPSNLQDYFVSFQIQLPFRIISLIAVLLSCNITTAER